MRTRKIISERHYKAGYVVREELVDGSEYGGETFAIKSAYTPGGHYIGDSKLGHRLCKKRGIKPELASPKDSICSIGFSEQDQKWFGWSHRAIYGFGVGSVAEKGDCVTEPGSIPEYIAEHPEADVSLPVGFEAKTLEDAKRMAVAFADSVG